MDSKAKRIGTGCFRLEDGSQIHYVPEKGEQLTWVRVQHQTTLTQWEEKRRKAHGYDLKKVLQVKACLEKNMRPMEIHKATGIARSSIDNYKKILFKKDPKLQTKDHQTTVKLDSVFFSLLVFSDLTLNTTWSIFLILIPLLIVLLVQYFRRQQLKQQQVREVRQQEIRQLRKLMHLVCNYSFRREPLICKTKVEQTYYKEILKHYNNRGRKVELIERQKQQSAHQHHALCQQFNEYYYALHEHDIKEGRLRAETYWKGLIKAGLLDYLSTPKGSKWQASQNYIHTVTQYLVNNPRPTSRDQAKQKFALDALPGETIEFNL